VGITEGPYGIINITMDKTTTIKCTVRLTTFIKFLRFASQKSNIGQNLCFVGKNTGGRELRLISTSQIPEKVKKNLQFESILYENGPWPQRKSRGHLRTRL